MKWRANALRMRDTAVSLEHMELVPDGSDRGVAFVWKSTTTPGLWCAMADGNARRVMFADSLEEAQEVAEALVVARRVETA